MKLCVNVVFRLPLKGRLDVHSKHGCRARRTRSNLLLSRLQPILRARRTGEPFHKSKETDEENLQTSALKPFWRSALTLNCAVIIQAVY